MPADSAGVLAWREELGALEARLGGLFVRAEPRRQAGLYLEGLLSAAKRKNGWQLAEQIGDARPWRTQRVLSHVLWDQDAARDLCRDHVLEHLGAADGALIDRELYLPESWCEDADKRAEAAIPEEVAFATKPALACRMIGRALDAGLPCAWVLGDEIYGSDRPLRPALERREQPLMLAIRSNEKLWAVLDRHLGQHPAARLAASIPPRAWRRL